jgi:hypothetical protein
MSVAYPQVGEKWSEGPFMDLRRDVTVLLKAQANNLPPSNLSKLIAAKFK